MTNPARLRLAVYVILSVILILGTSSAAWDPDAADAEDSYWIQVASGDITLRRRHMITNSGVRMGDASVYQQLVSMFLENWGKEPQNGVTTEDSTEASPLGWVQWFEDDEGIANRDMEGGWSFVASAQGQSLIQAGSTFNSKYEFKVTRLTLTMNSLTPDHYDDEMHAFDELQGNDTIPEGAFPNDDGTEGVSRFGLTLTTARVDVHCWFKGWWKGVNPTTDQVFHEVRQDAGKPGAKTTVNGHVWAWVDNDP